MPCPASHLVEPCRIASETTPSAKDCACEELQSSAGAPELELQAVVAQAAQLLVVLVVADADDGQLGRLDAQDEVLHAAAVARAHAIHFIHNQADLRAARTQASGKVFSKQSRQLGCCRERSCRPPHP